MTPTEQAAAILAACGANRGTPTRAAITALISAAAIRAAVDQVLPREEAPALMRGPDLERLAQRQHTRAQLLAIVDALEPQP